MRPDPPVVPIPPDSLVLPGFSGLRNTVQPEKLAAAELEIALNVDLDDAGQVSRRAGVTRLATGSWGSAFNLSDGRLLCVHDGAIGVLSSDLSFAALGPTPGDVPVCWVQVGDTVYWSSPEQNGKLVGPELTPAAWGSVVGWLSYAPDSPHIGRVAGRVVAPPPPCTSMCWNSGRIYMAVGTIVWFTDLFNYDVVDKTASYWPFEGEVAFVASTTTDIYVGTSEGVWYVGGGAAAPKRKRIMDGAAVPGSAITMPSDLTNPVALRRKPDQESSIAVAFMTDRGFYVGHDGGMAYNLSEATFAFPRAQSATSGFRQQAGLNQYLVDLKGSGTPQSRAAFGDYADGSISPLAWSGAGSSVGPADLDRIRTAALVAPGGSIRYDDPGQATGYAATVPGPLMHTTAPFVTDNLASVFSGAITWAGGVLSGPDVRALLRVEVQVELPVSSATISVMFGGVPVSRQVTSALAGETVAAQFLLLARLDGSGQTLNLLSSSPALLRRLTLSVIPLP